MVFRENTEGLYTYGKGAFTIGNEAAVNQLIVSRRGAERIVRAAFDMCSRRNGAPADGVKRVTCVDKANAAEAYVFFRKVFDEVAEEYQDIQTEHFFADAMTVQMSQRPDHFDVVVMENMLGDILSDLGSGTIGGSAFRPPWRWDIGMACSSRSMAAPRTLREKILETRSQNRPRP